MSRPSLTEKEKRYVAAYLGEAAGNGTAAARLAGYRGNANVLGVTSSQLLRKPKIVEAVAERQASREQAAIADADERDRILTEILRDATAGWDNRIRAISQLNKVTGRHITRRRHKHSDPIVFNVVTGVPAPK